MNLLSDLEDFVHDHRPHGTLTGDATEPAWNGYLLTVACLCGVVFNPQELTPGIVSSSAWPHPAPLEVVSAIQLGPIEG